MITKLGRWLRDAILILGITAALIGLLELGLRLYMGPPGYRFDSELIAALAPNASKIYLRSVDGGPRLVPWKTNAQGFRGPALEGNPPLRVMVYGDSNVQARFSTQAETFTGQIQRLLGEARPGGVEVINAGMVGYGPDQNLIRLEAELGRYEPDLIVFHIFTENDFGDIIRNRIFELDESGNLVRSRHPVTEDPRMPTDWWRQTPGALLGNSMIETYADAFRRGRARTKTPHPPLEHDPERFREKSLGQHAREYAVYSEDSARRYSMFSDHYESDIAFAPELESAQTKRKLLAAVLQRASRFAEAQGVPFVVVIQPNSRDLTTNLPNHYQALEGSAGYDRRRLNRWVVEICEESKIDFIDLFDTFEGSGNPEALYFPTPDPHWNEAGQLVAAEAVADWIDASLR